MKNVLIIANLLHAFPRIPKISMYLPKFGWKATIITPKMVKCEKETFGFLEDFFRQVEVIEVPYKGDIFWLWRKVFKILGFNTKESLTEQIKRQIGIDSEKSFLDIIVKWYHMFFAYPDTEKTWIKPALRAIDNILEEKRFDVLLSSSPFPTTHIISARSKQKFNLPWIADFRDPWTQNHNYPYKYLRKYLEKNLELKTIKSADIITAASPAYAEKQKYFHKKNVFVVTNGFDPKDLNSEDNIELTPNFTITYTGTIYPRKQNPSKLFNALRRLIDRRVITPTDIEVRFFGQKYHWLESTIKKYGLVNIVKQYGKISRRESLRLQKESQILLLLNWENERGVYPLKFFEYLGAQRPILAIGGIPKDDIENIILNTQAGVYASTVEEIEIALSNFYKEYKSLGRVSYNGNLTEINKYNYVQKAKEFAEILNKVANK